MPDYVARSALDGRKKQNYVCIFIPPPDKGIRLNSADRVPDGRYAIVFRPSETAAMMKFFADENVVAQLDHGFNRSGKNKTKAWSRDLIASSYWTKLTSGPCKFTDIPKVHWTGHRYMVDLLKGVCVGTTAHGRTCVCQRRPKTGKTECYEDAL